VKLHFCRRCRLVLSLKVMVEESAMLDSEDNDYYLRVMGVISSAPLFGLVLHHATIHPRTSLVREKGRNWKKKRKKRRTSRILKHLFSLLPYLH
jgi:hypothetical protein